MAKAQLPVLITPEGYAKLKSELEHLWRQERPRVTAEVEAAAAEGDRSENAEYIYGKRKMAEIDRRLSFLGRRLEVLKIVDEPPQRDGRVYFGAWVTLQDEDGQRVRYQIVGSDEVMTSSASPSGSEAQGKRISMESPLAQALLRKHVGDEVTFQRPKGEITYEIIDVSYGTGA